jgi:hypothetical protein
VEGTIDFVGVGEAVGLEGGAVGCPVHAAAINDSAIAAKRILVMVPLRFLSVIPTYVVDKSGHRRPAIERSVGPVVL